MLCVGEIENAVLTTAKSRYNAAAAGSGFAVSQARKLAPLGSDNFVRSGFQPVSMARVIASAATTKASVRTRASLSGSKMRVECVLKKSVAITSAASQQASIPALQAAASRDVTGLAARDAAAADASAEVLVIDQLWLSEADLVKQADVGWCSVRLVTLQRRHKLLQAGAFGIGCCYEGCLGVRQGPRLFSQLYINLRKRAAQ